MQDKVLQCPACQSEYVYLSRKKGLYVCEDCDNEFHYVIEKSNGKQLFFSYGHDNNTWIVNKIKSDLEARGFTVWIDYQRINTGDNWRSKITEGLAGSSHVIAFLSSHSMRDKGVCGDELRIALCEKCGYIQPVLLESTDTFSPPQSLTEVQWIDMSDWHLYEPDSPDFQQWYSSKLAQFLSVLDSKEVRELSGDITTLKNMFKPKLLSMKESSLIKKEFYGREWLFEEINRASDVSVIQILGSAGTGKSAIAARLQYHLPSVVGSWYCSWNDALSFDAVEFLKTFIFKLAVSIGEYRRHILSHFCDFEAILLGGSVYEMIEKMIHLPMQYVIDGGREAHYFIIDGLDESIVNGKSEIINALKILIDIMPPWFKFIITSRAQKEVISAFGSVKTKSIDLDENENSIIDFDFYLQQNGLKKESVIKQNFLFAELIVNSGKQNLELKNGLSDYYRLVFERVFEGGSYKESEKTALCMLINCVAPITEDVILNAFGKSTGEFIRFTKKLCEFLSFGVERFRVFWNVRTVTLFHASFKEWLISDDAGIYKIDLAESVEIALNFYKKTLDENSVDVTQSFVKNYELFLAKNHRFDILDSLRKDERYALIKQKIALNEDYSNKESKVAHLDADKVAKMDALSHKISLLSHPIKYHYANPLTHHAGGVMDDYCEYYVFPCCNHMQVCDGVPHTVTETGCRSHYLDAASLPEPITLSAYDEFQFWKNQLVSECDRSEKLYERIYRSVYQKTLRAGNFQGMGEADKEFVLKMIENAAKASFATTMRYKTENILCKLRALKDKAGVSDDEFEEITALADNVIAE